MVMEGRYKYIHCESDPPQLYDLANDYKELENLAGRADVAEVETRLAAVIAANWDLEELKQSVMENQRRRRTVDQAHAMGREPFWDYDTTTPGKDQYFRPCAANPSASNYNSSFEVRLRPDSEIPNLREFP